MTFFHMQINNIVIGLVILLVKLHSKDLLDIQEDNFNK